MIINSLPPPALIWKNVPNHLLAYSNLCPFILINDGDLVFNQQLMTYRVIKTNDGIYIKQYACLTEKQYFIQAKIDEQKSLEQQYFEENGHD